MSAAVGRSTVDACLVTGGAGTHRLDDRRPAGRRRRRARSSCSTTSSAAARRTSPGAGLRRGRRVVEGDIRDRALVDRADRRHATSSSTWPPSASPSAPRSRGWPSRCWSTALQRAGGRGRGRRAARSSPRRRRRSTAWPSSSRRPSGTTRTTTTRSTARRRSFNEGLLRSFHAMYGLDYVALRYFNVYGPRMDIHGVYTEVLIRWMERIAAGQPPLILGDGRQTMDFVYVDDIARANLLAAEADVTDEVFNIACGDRDQPARARAGAAARSWAPTSAASTARRGRSTASPAAWPTPPRPRERLGFKAEVDLDEGLRGLVDWWRAEQRGGDRGRVDVIPVMRPLLGDEEAEAAAAAVPPRAGSRRAPGRASSSRAFAARVGAPHGVAVSSLHDRRCTSRWSLLGVGPGDEVVVPSLSFIATANARALRRRDARLRRRRPAHAQPHRRDDRRAALGPRTRAVIVVHQAGVPADLDALAGALRAAWHRRRRGRRLRGRLDLPRPAGRGGRRLVAPVVPPAQAHHHRRGRHADGRATRRSPAAAAPARARHERLAPRPAREPAASCSRRTSRPASTTG